MSKKNQKKKKRKKKKEREKEKEKKNQYYTIKQRLNERENVSVIHQQLRINVEPPIPIVDTHAVTKSPRLLTFNFGDTSAGISDYWNGVLECRTTEM